jgi:hypothetical protein
MEIWRRFVHGFGGTWVLDREARVGGQWWGRREASGGRRGGWGEICGWDLGEDGFCSRGTEGMEPGEDVLK